MSGLVTRFMRYGAAVAAFAGCCACAGLSAGAPPTRAFNVSYNGRTLIVNGRPVTAARLSPLPRYATILPERRGTARDFEYISNVYYGGTSIFDYPKSTKQFATLENAGGGGCGSVLYGYGKYFWLFAASNEIEEFKPVKKPIRTLSVSAGTPSSCAMNTSGDLAVGIFAGSEGGEIVIYTNASGSGKVIATPLRYVYFVGYDNHGNLFADGFSGSDTFQLVELPKGGSTVETITTSNAVQFPGSLQWDGKYLAVFDQVANAAYRYTVSGTDAMLRDTVRFSGSSDCAQTWIVRGLLYCADAGNNDGEVFAYPAGGSAIAVLTGNFDFAIGVTAAKK